MKVDRCFENGSYFSTLTGFAVCDQAQPGQVVDQRWRRQAKRPQVSHEKV